MDKKHKKIKIADNKYHDALVKAGIPIKQCIKEPFDTKYKIIEIIRK